MIWTEIAQGAKTHPCRKGEYYDPSYGKKYSGGLAQIDHMAIAGYYIGPIQWPVDEATVGLDLNGNGTSNDVQVLTRGVYLFKKNPAGLDLYDIVEKIVKI